MFRQGSRGAGASEVWARVPAFRWAALSHSAILSLFLTTTYLLLPFLSAVGNPRI